MPIFGASSAPQGSGTPAEWGYWVIEALAAFLGLALQILLIIIAVWWLRSRKQRKDTGFSIKEWLPGNVGRRARVERKHLKIRGPHYPRKTVKAKLRRFFNARHGVNK